MNILILFLVVALVPSVTGFKSHGCIRNTNTRSKNAFILSDSSKSSSDGYPIKRKTLGEKKAKDTTSSNKKPRLLKVAGGIRKAYVDTIEDVLDIPEVQVVDTSYRLRRPPPKVEAAPSKKKPKPEQETKVAKMKEQERLAPYVKFEPEELAEEAFAANLEQVMNPSKTFTDLGITDLEILRNLETMGVFNPTKIQDLALGAFADDSTGIGDKGRKEIVLHAQTGSGKTLGFLLPLTKIIDPNAKKIQALIIAPSRELVQQIASVARELFANTGIKTVSLIGGTNVLKL
jgi:primosomal protein N'